MKRNLVSIIIPAYNEEEVIGDCIKSLKEQSYKNIEIIIIDDGSTDKTAEIVKSFKKVRLIKGQHNGMAVSRNLGAKNASGEILVFGDADMTFDKDYIKFVIKPIVEGKEIATEEGTQIASNKDNIWSRCWGQYFKSDSHIKYGSDITAIKRSDFFKMGQFDPSLGYMADKTFNIKHGLKTLWVHEAICYHKNPSTLKEVYKQSIWIGSSLNKKLLKIPVINILATLLAIILSPIAVIILSLRKSYKNQNFKIFFPWMIIFMAVRYFGTVHGIFKKILFNRNIR